MENGNFFTAKNVYLGVTGLILFKKNFNKFETILRNTVNNCTTQTFFLFNYTVRVADRLTIFLLSRLAHLHKYYIVGGLL